MGEEVLRQLIIPGLRESIVQLCVAEQIENTECDLMQHKISDQSELLEEVESVLISFLPGHLQAFFSNYNSNEKDAFSRTIAEIDRLVHLEALSNKLGTKSSMSSLEEITFLPKIVETLLKEIELHKTLST